MMTDEQRYEKFLAIIAKDLDITDTPDIDELHRQFSGSQLWMKAKIIARSMHIAYLEGKQDGITECKQIMEDTHA